MQDCFEPFLKYKQTQVFLCPQTRMWGTSPTNRGSGAIPWKNFDKLNAGSKVCHREHCKFWPDLQPKARLERLYSVWIFIITLTLIYNSWISCNNYQPVVKYKWMRLYLMNYLHKMATWVLKNLKKLTIFKNIQKLTTHRIFS